MRTAIIVQARMGSTRLPGKVMEIVEDKPLILHIIDRLLKARRVDLIILATTTSKLDDPLVDLINGYHPRVKVFRGSEENVLERYYKAAKKYGAEVIVRITGDCPFADPSLIDKLILEFKKNRFDYISNVLGKRTFPRGLDTEVFSIGTLEKILKKKLTKADKEHVTWYIKKNPEEFLTKNYENRKDLSHMRWVVDEFDDLVFVREVFSHLYKNNRFFTTKQILELLEKKPQLGRINSHIQQKKVEGRDDAK